MWTFFTSILLFIASYFLWGQPVGTECNGVVGMLALTVAIVFLIIAIGWFVTDYNYQITDIETIQEEAEDEIVYAEKAEVLTAEFKQYLVDLFPEHEKSIFDKLRPENVATFAAAYPEIKADQTVMAMVKAINELQSKVYTTRTNRNRLRRKIRTRKRNVFYWGLFLPEYQGGELPEKSAKEE